MIFKITKGLVEVDNYDIKKKNNHNKNKGQRAAIQPSRFKLAKPPTVIYAVNHKDLE